MLVLSILTYKNVRFLRNRLYRQRVQFQLTSMILLHINFSTIEMIPFALFFTHITATLYDIKTKSCHIYLILFTC